MSKVYNETQYLRSRSCPLLPRHSICQIVLNNIKYLYIFYYMYQVMYFKGIQSIIKYLTAENVLYT